MRRTFPALLLRSSSQGCRTGAVHRRNLVSAASSRRTTFVSTAETIAESAFSPASQIEVVVMLSSEIGSGETEPGLVKVFCHRSSGESTFRKPDLAVLNQGETECVPRNGQAARPHVTGNDVAAPVASQELLDDSNLPEVIGRARRSCRLPSSPRVLQNPEPTVTASPGTRSHGPSGSGRGAAFGFRHRASFRRSVLRGGSPRRTTVAGMMPMYFSKCHCVALSANSRVSR